MKEIYSWVPWFRELSSKIADGGPKFLLDRARQIPWKKDGSEPQLLKFGDNNIDPFSFIYSLAGYSRDLKRLYPSVGDVFGLTSELPIESDDAFIFPTPPHIGVLFHSGGAGNPEVLWRLFRSADQGLDSVQAEDFELALHVKSVGVKKLTQALFLINAPEFLPYDNATMALSIADAAPSKNMRWKAYRDLLDKISKAFPECMPYEISLFAYLSSRPYLKVNPDRCFQISTNAYNDGRDLWDNFSSNNWAFTGGPGKGSWSEYTPDGGQKRYPIDKVQKGDILLVRFANQGRGVGVVFRNDFKRRLTDEARLHVIWVNKRATKLSSGPRALGFSHGHGKIGDAFLQAYPETFRILHQMHDSPETLPSPPPPPPAGKHALATILYGPPGTGKTYATARRCVEICDGKVPKSLDDRRARYDELVDEGRIDFVTFHQSYSYEEFVEGLRPVASDGEGSGMQLAVIKGVLRQIAERARKVPEIGTRRIFKMSLGDPQAWGGTPQGNKIFLECIDNGCVLLEYGGDIDWSDAVYGDREEIFKRWRKDKDPDATAYSTDIQAMWRFRTEMRQGDIVVVSDGYRHFRAVGEISGDYEFEPRKDGFHHRRAVQWHWQVRERQGEPASVFRDGPFQWRPINLLTPANPEGLLPFLSGIREIGGTLPHVLIIDEINRANISKVMGELITLLEEDKREDAENEVAVTLPYSRERFTLPANLYILGTMNTADRFHRTA